MTNTRVPDIICCHECGLLHRREPIPVGAKASCSVCGSLLYRHVPDSVDRSLALYITALLLFIIANSFPFLSLELGGRQVDSLLVSSAWVMYQLGMGELGLLIFITSVAFPFVVIVGMVFLLTAARFGHFPPFGGPVYRLVKSVLPWSLTGVFMLGTLISVVKLQGLANVVFGPALLAFALLLFVGTAARVSFDPSHLWSLHDAEPTTLLPKPNNEDPLLHCHTCGFVAHASDRVLENSHRCPRCTSPMHHRIHNSLEKTWALLFSASVLFIPANVYPVMTVVQFGKGAPSTIVGGVMTLIELGMWGLAMLVFIASVVVPVTKLLILAFLCISVQRNSSWRPKDRTLLYRITEVVGAWSMVDIFLVGLLSALVSLGTLSTITPGIGAIFFAGVVVLTMFAAHSFDPRLIWDNLPADNTQKSSTQTIIAASAHKNGASMHHNHQEIPE